MALPLAGLGRRASLQVALELCVIDLGTGLPYSFRQVGAEVSDFTVHLVELERATRPQQLSITRPSPIDCGRRQESSSNAL